MIFLEISYNDLAKYNYLEIIDIRDEGEYNKGHFPNSLNILFSELIINPSKYLKKNKKYLLVCEYGIKSKKTSQILNNMGYQTYSLMGGIKNI